MAHTAGDIIDGREMMVYLNTGTAQTPTYTPQAAATSHTVSYSAETKERITKDTASGSWAKKRVTKLSATIKCEALVAYGSAAGLSLLKKAFKAKEEVKVKYSLVDAASSDEYEEGMFVISSLEESSPADGDASYSATLESSGEITTKTGAAA